MGLGARTTRVGSAGGGDGRRLHGVGVVACHKRFEIRRGHEWVEEGVVERGPDDELDTRIAADGRDAGERNGARGTKRGNEKQIGVHRLSPEVVARGWNSRRNYTVHRNSALPKRRKQKRRWRGCGRVRRDFLIGCLAGSWGQTGR